MRRVVRASLTIAMATAMIGFAVTQARADRIGYMADRCFGAGCVNGAVKIGELALSFTESSLAVLEAEASATALADFSPELGGTSGISFAGASVSSPRFVGAGSTAERTSVLQSSAAPATFSTGGIALSFSRQQLPIFTSSPADLARSVTMPTIGSFNVTSVDLSVSRTAPYQANDAQPVGDIDPVPPGGDPNAVPEPTTMLLLGTGLVGVAAVVRKRLKVRATRSK